MKTFGKKYTLLYWIKNHACNFFPSVVYIWYCGTSSWWNNACMLVTINLSILPIAKILDHRSIMNHVQEFTILWVMVYKKWGPNKRTWTVDIFMDNGHDLCVIKKVSLNSERLWRLCIICFFWNTKIKVLFFIYHFSPNTCLRENLLWKK